MILTNLFILIHPFIICGIDTNNYLLEIITQIQIKVNPISKFNEKIVYYADKAYVHMLIMYSDST